MAVCGRKDIVLAYANGCARQVTFHLVAYWPPVTITDPQSFAVTAAAGPTMAGIFAFADQRFGV